MFFLDFFSNSLLYVILFINIWVFFLRSNFLSIRLLADQTTKLKNVKIIKHQHNFYFNEYGFYILILIYFSFFLENGEEGFFFYQHCYFSNSNYYTLMIIYMFLLFAFFVILKTPNTNILFNNDYCFSIISIALLTPFFYSTNTLYSFVFVLETISLVIFYKFTVSKFWFKQKSLFSQKEGFLDKTYSRSHTNVLFFQYWVNFFSSIIIFFVLINVVYLYGSTEWFFLNFINSLNKENLFFNDFESTLVLWIPFFISIFLKIGLTPLHLFKIEVYKGIPYITIFFYTTYYFLLYFIMTIIFIKNYLSSFYTFWWLFFFLIIVIGIVYTISLLFDVFFTKAFFAYSTVINSLGFFILLVSLF